jgi:hypothetical protein
MSSVKLGNKLEVTDIKERMKLLIDGEVFTDDSGFLIYYEDFGFCFDGPVFEDLNEKTALKNWYYPAKTYTINGVELVDERIDYVEAKKRSGIFVSDIENTSMYKYLRAEETNDSYLVTMCIKSLVHFRKEAAIAHTKAMIRVEGE